MFKKMMTGVAVILFSLSMGGCLAVLAGGAAGGGTAMWLSNKLTQEFNAPYDQTVTASENAIKSLGYEITSEKKGESVTQLKSVYTDGKEIWIDIRRISDHSTKVEVRVGAVNPDKEASQKILKAIQSNL